MQTLIMSVLGLPLVGSLMLAQLHVLQRKEYRLDRLRAAIQSSELRYAVWPWLATLLTTPILLILSTTLQIFGSAITLSLLAIDYANRIRKRGILRPQFTAKMQIISVICCLIVISLGISWAGNSRAGLWWLGVYLLLPCITTTSVLIVNAIADIKKRDIIRKAKLHRAALRDIKVVGITGSFGKTSTKYFAAQLVPHAVASKEHRNNELVIAQDMLAQLTPRTKSYLVEMGAYIRGEIADLSRLAKPRIGIITCIGNQHLALFKSKENILAAKWELIESLPENGIAILNADDRLLRQKAQTYDKEIVWYSATQPADIYADQIEIHPTAITCRLHIKDSVRHITIPLASKAMLSSALAAVSIAEVLGVDRNHIAYSLQRLKSVSRTMEIRQTTMGSIVIDDSYSAGELSALNAIEHIKTFSHPDKRIVLVPLIELGSSSAAVHKRIGKSLAATKAKVIAYGNSYERELREGFANNNGDIANFHITTDPRELIKQTTKGISKDTVLLLEGRVPAILRETLALS